MAASRTMMNSSGKAALQLLLIHGRLRPSSAAAASTDYHFSDSSTPFTNPIDLYNKGKFQYPISNPTIRESPFLIRSRILSRGAPITRYTVDENEIDDASGDSDSDEIHCFDDDDDESGSEDCEDNHYDDDDDDRK